MYGNVLDTSIHIPSVWSGLPGVLSRSRRKDLLVLRSMKVRETSAQDDARKGRVWILGWTRNAKRRAEQGRPGQGAMSLRRVIPFLAIALTRDARYARRYSPPRDLPLFLAAVLVRFLWQSKAGISFPREFPAASTWLSTLYLLCTCIPRFLLSCIKNVIKLRNIRSLYYCNCKKV